MDGGATARLRALRADPRLREFAAFLVTGLGSAAVHYGTMIALVEAGGVAPVPASLSGYVAGGYVSYSLNRAVTFRSDRPHREAFWRFVLVATIGFGLTGIVLSVLHDGFGLPYLPAQLGTTGIVLFWSFAANKLWTFRRGPVPPVA